jgi:hypothetical protein
MSNLDKRLRKIEEQRAAEIARNLQAREQLKRVEIIRRHECAAQGIPFKPMRFFVMPPEIRKQPYIEKLRWLLQQGRLQSAGLVQADGPLMLPELGE